MYNLIKYITSSPKLATTSQYSKCKLRISMVSNAKGQSCWIRTLLCEPPHMQRIIFQKLSKFACTYTAFKNRQNKY